ncbi:hypothetical protein [Nocardia tengchongensis]|uniref:hypothetical protein n=1 Tax=Nocardia tengchongensis TaxID=2055889 RepID=UPI0036931600
MIRTAAIVTMTAGSLLSASAAVMQPVSADPAKPAVVGYRSEVSAAQVVTTIDAGTFAPAADGGSIVVSDDAGQVVGQLPLAFALNGIRYDIRHDNSAGGRTLDLAPDLASAQPIASPLENQLAANDSLGNFGTALALGPLAGAAAGAIVGAVVAVATCAVIAVGCLVTGLPIIGIFAATGGLGGTILAGLVGGWNSGLSYLNTLNAPPGQSSYAKDGQGTDGAGIPDSPLRFPRLPSGSSSGSSK